MGGIRVGKGQMEGWEESAARPKAAAADWIAHLKRGATMIMALQKWEGEIVKTSERQCCVKNDAW